MKSVITVSILKIVLATFLLLCLFDMPYGYYQLVRYIALVGFGIIAYYEFKSNNKILGVIFFSLAILFQPFIKISLGSEIWKIVDVIVAIFLLASLFIKKDNNKTKIFLGVLIILAFLTPWLFYDDIHTPKKNPVIKKRINFNRGAFDGFNIDMDTN
ncbi:DUF6804 family protein [Mesohalobacter halotolerans]|uniref:DUF6804 family protein n=1 Tax=Mesohalobacter halotolerans TaxID=1883405 RepID=UPI001FE7A537|nr:DUF6804 family protein [Mesohalobacter halotolerans]